jgi:hypothetical protein
MTVEKTVYIVGTTAHWSKTPWGQDAEYWGMNSAYDSQGLERFTRWFELHDLKTMYEDYPGQERPEHLEWLKQEQPIPVYAWEEEIERLPIPSGVSFPTDKVLGHFAPFRYFTNTVTWLVGLAIVEGFTKIGLYGVDMATKKEHRRERPSVEWLLGWAMGAGIKIALPPGCDLLHVSYLYGREQATDVTEKVRAYLAELEERRDSAWEKKIRAEKAYYQLLGAMDALEYVDTSWLEKPDDS